MGLEPPLSAASGAMIKALRFVENTKGIGKGYSTKEMVAKLRRLADCLEQGKPFQIQIAGERVRVLPKAVFNVEHERKGGLEEVEFQFKWETS